MRKDSNEDQEENEFGRRRGKGCRESKQAKLKQVSDLEGRLGDREVVELYTLRAVQVNGV